MSRPREINIWVLILLPLVIILLVNPFPRPRVVEASLSKAGNRLQHDHPEQALIGLEQAASILPGRADLWMKAGESAFNAQEFASTIRNLEQAQRLNPLPVTDLVILGDAYRAQNELARAIQTWKNAIERAGPSAEIYQRLRDAHSQQNDFSAMADDLHAWLKIDPHNASLLFQMAELAALVDPDQVNSYASQAAQSDPNLTSQTMTLQGGVALALSQEDKAYRSLLIGRTLGSLGEWSLAAAAFRQSIQVNPGYAEAWAFLGESLQQLQQDGFQELQQAETLNPKSVVVWVLQSLYWKRQNKLDQALVCLQKAQALEPKNPVWEAEIANTFAETGELELASVHYQAAIQLAPQNPMYLRMLAEFCAAYGYKATEIGLPAARAALVLNPDDAANQDVMGQLFIRLGDLNSAERFLSRALELNPDFALSHLHLGSLYLQIGQPDQARLHLEKAVALAGKSVVAQQAQSLLRQYFP